jgi:cytochrome c oxidase cbb3-type subunit IV
MAEFLTDLRPLFTVVSFVTFIAICLWAFSSRRKADFDEAANLPFADEEQDHIQAAIKAGAHHG